MTTIGSLCTGYGGLDMAVTAAAGRPADVAWHAETDPDASLVLAHHHPDVPNLGDITNTDWGRVARVDVLTAGFPCQPFSAAGRQRGTADDRHLWPVGVLPAITALRPPVVVLENVPRVLTIERGGVWGVILADLAGLGYTVRWCLLGACTLGFCHHRHRLFAVATLSTPARPAGEPVAMFADGAWSEMSMGLFGDPTVPTWPPGGVMVDGMVWPVPVAACGTTGGRLPTPTARDARRGSGWGDTPGRPLTEVIAGLMPTPTAADGHGGPGQGQRVEGGANLRTATALLPTPIAGDSQSGAGSRNSWGTPTLGGLLAFLPAAGHAVRDAGDAVVALCPTPRASDADKGGPGARGSKGDPQLPAAVMQWGRYAQAVDRHAVAVGRPAPAPTTTGVRGGQVLNPVLCEWMIGLPAGYLTGPLAAAGANRFRAGKAAIRLAGNGVVPAQGAAALRLLGWGS